MTPLVKIDLVMLSHRRHRHLESGQTIYEYGFILGSIALVVILLLQLLGSNTKDAQCKVSRGIGGTATENGACKMVFGQLGDFGGNAANSGGISSGSLDAPIGLTLDGAGGAYVADKSNNRVLYYPPDSTTATRVYGQSGSFSTNTANNGGISADSLSLPWALALDPTGGLYVGDTGNHRVLYYPAGSTTATRVYGQSGSFSTNTANNGGISADSLGGAGSLALDTAGGLYVGDGNNSRVLYFASRSTTASRVYGQHGNFGCGVFNNNGACVSGLQSADNLHGPAGLAIDSRGDLYISEDWNNRVMMFPPGSTTASAVYGQAGAFVGGANNTGGLSAASLWFPEQITVDGTDRLYVADYGNNRVLSYPRLSGCTAPNTPASCSTADRVYGQGGSFTTGTANNGGISAASLDEPISVYVDPRGSLYIVDYLNNRVVVDPAQ